MTARKPTFFASATSVQRWLRALLVCTVFAALQGTLGAWVVPAVSGSPAVQVCTPYGVQWVAVSNSDDQDQRSDTAAMASCVWTHAQLGAGPGPTPSPGWSRLMDPCTLIPRCIQNPDVLPDNAQRVLLMSAMRAPPHPATTQT